MVDINWLSLSVVVVLAGVPNSIRLQVVLALVLDYDYVGVLVHIVDLDDVVVDNKDHSR